MATATVVTVGRSEQAIRDALAAHGTPEDVERFEHELSAAGTGKTEQGDRDQVLRRWQGFAMMAANPLPLDERAQLARIKAGDLAGIPVYDSVDGWDRP
jgi:hypothetical protein